MNHHVWRDRGCKYCGLRWDLERGPRGGTIYRYWGVYAGTVARRPSDRKGVPPCLPDLYRRKK